MAAQPALLLQPMGQIAPYDPNGPLSFSNWVQLFEDYCTVNMIPSEPVDPTGTVLNRNNRRRALFLTSIGQRAYSILCAILLPYRPSDRPIPILVNALMNRFQPPGMLPANRMHFHSRVRRPNESALDFICAIQELANKCQFGIYLEEALRDKLVCGINHPDTQRRMMSTPNLDYERAKHISLQEDAIRDQTRRLAAATNVNAIKTGNFCRQNVPGPQRGTGRSSRGRGRKNYRQGGGNQDNRNNSNRRDESKSQTWQSNQNNPNQPKPKCGRCGRNHDEKSCPARNWRCYGCEGWGHVKSCCKKSVNKVETDEQPRTSPTSKPHAQETEETDLTSSFSLFDL